MQSCTSESNKKRTMRHAMRTNKIELETISVGPAKSDSGRQIPARFECFKTTLHAGEVHTSVAENGKHKEMKYLKFLPVLSPADVCLVANASDKAATATLSQASESWEPRGRQQKPGEKNPFDERGSVVAMRQCRGLAMRQCPLKAKKMNSFQARRA